MTLVLAEAYLHRLDPFAIPFPSGWPLGGIRWYGLAYLAGFIIAWLIIRGLARSHRTPLPERSVGDLMVYFLIGVLVGGRLGYCLFYDQSLFVKFMPRFPFWGLLAINEGGMASHGGVVGVALACWLFGLRHHLSRLHLLDLAAFTCPPGLFLGRLANFVNAELWGRALPASMQDDPPWWSITYVQELAQHAELRDALSAALAEVGVSGDDWNFAVERLVEAAREGNVTVIETVRPLLTAYYPSQFIQAITDGPVLMALLVAVWWGPRKPGVVASWFLIGYAVMRLLSERVRQPDAGVAMLSTPIADLSRGQVLSLLMLAAGVLCLVCSVRREVEPIGGLGKRG